MGELQTSLTAMLIEAGGSVTRRLLPRITYPKIVDLLAADEAMRIHENLGGSRSELRISPAAWDLEVDGIAVEFDEFLHFNRYRLATLNSTIYCEMPNFPLLKYVEYCKKHEDRCIKGGRYGGKWSNESSSRQFGSAASPGDLSGNGSPRWKQRAFYDFIKDLAPRVLKIRMARIAVWDEIQVGDKLVAIWQALRRPNGSPALSILELVATRAETG